MMADAAMLSKAAIEGKLTTRADAINITAISEKWWKA